MTDGTEAIIEGPVRVRSEFSGEVSTVVVRGTWDEACPHLAVTEALGQSIEQAMAGSERWVVTHVPSGAAVNRPGQHSVLLMNRNAAVELRRRLVPVADWSRKRLTPDAIVAARQVVNGFLQEGDPHA